MSIDPPIQVLASARFDSEVRQLAKRYRRIRLDQAAQLSNTSVDDFYQLLIDRNLVTPPAEPDDDPDELILASLRLSLQQAQAGKVHPISELRDSIDD